MKKMALLIFIVLMGIGCGNKAATESELRQQMFDDMRGCLDQIPEAERRDKILALVDKIEGDLGQMRENVAQFVAANKELNADYDATREDFNKLQREFNASRKKFQQQILTTKFQLKELTTEAEWAALIKIKNSMMQELLNKK
ncbi:MAG: hypothetical protein ACYSWP_01045 [Planctomycetota bacterium]|jgi:Skp family chaperone for outer membrane proteins